MAKKGETATIEIYADIPSVDGYEIITYLQNNQNNVFDWSSCFSEVQKEQVFTSSSGSTITSSKAVDWMRQRVASGATVDNLVDEAQNAGYTVVDLAQAAQYAGLNVTDITDVISGNVLQKFDAKLAGKTNAEKLAIYSALSVKLKSLADQLPKNNTFSLK